MKIKIMNDEENVNGGLMAFSFVLFSAGVAVLGILRWLF